MKTENLFYMNERVIIKSINKIGKVIAMLGMETDNHNEERWYEVTIKNSNHSLIGDHFKQGELIKY